MVIGFFKENRWLSNMYPIHIQVIPNKYYKVISTTELPVPEVHTLSFNSTEAAYHAHKFFYPGMESVYKKMQDMDGYEAKKFADFMKGAIRKDWDNVKVEVMGTLIKVKFMDPVLRRKLVSSGDSIFIEANGWHDIFWGKCYCARCQGIGLNTLGKIIGGERNSIINSISNNRKV